MSAPDLRGRSRPGPAWAKPPLSCSDQETTILEYYVPIQLDGSFTTRILDDIAMDGRAVVASARGIGATQSQVDGAAHLLVEEHILVEAIDGVVGAEGEFTHPARAGIRGEHMVEQRFVLSGRRAHQLAALPRQPDVSHLSPAEDTQLEGDVTAHTLRLRSRVDLAIGHIDAPVGHQPLATGHGKGQVRLLP